MKDSKKLIQTIGNKDLIKIYENFTYARLLRILNRDRNKKFSPYFYNSDLQNELEQTIRDTLSKYKIASTFILFWEIPDKIIEKYKWIFKNIFGYFIKLDMEHKQFEYPECNRFKKFITDYFIYCELSLMTANLHLPYSFPILIENSSDVNIQNWSEFMNNLDPVSMSTVNSYVNRIDEIIKLISNNPKRYRIIKNKETNLSEFYYTDNQLKQLRDGLLIEASFVVFWQSQINQINNTIEVKDQVNTIIEELNRSIKDKIDSEPKKNKRSFKQKEFLYKKKIDLEKFMQFSPLTWDMITIQVYNFKGKLKFRFSVNNVYSNYIYPKDLGIPKNLYENDNRIMKLLNCFFNNNGLCPAKSNKEKLKEKKKIDLSDLEYQSKLLELVPDTRIKHQVKDLRRYLRRYFTYNGELIVKEKSNPKQPDSLPIKRWGKNEGYKNYKFKLILKF